MSVNFVYYILSNEQCGAFVSQMDFAFVIDLFEDMKLHNCYSDKKVHTLILPNTNLFPSSYLDSQGETLPICLLPSSVWMGLVSCSGARHAIEFPISLEGNLTGLCRAGPCLTPQTSQSSENGQEHLGFRSLLFCLLLTEIIS